MNYSIHIIGIPNEVFGSYKIGVKRCYEHQWASYLAGRPKESFYASFPLPGKEQLYDDIITAGNNFDVAYTYLQKYSLPYLSEVMVRDDSIEDYKELVDKYNLIVGLVPRSGHEAKLPGLVLS